MKSIYFFLIIVVSIFISYLDLHYNLKGFLIISFDLTLILYLSIKNFAPNFLIDHSFNFIFFYFFLFVGCFYSLFFLCTSFFFTNNEGLIYSDLNKFEIVKVLFLYPILEELIFRKYLLVSLSGKRSEINSIFVLSLGFTLIHCMTNSALLYVFLLSIFLSWSYLKTRNIYLSISLHIFNNFLSITNLVSFLSNFKSISFCIVILILVLLIIFTLFKVKKYTLNKGNVSD